MKNLITQLFMANILIKKTNTGELQYGHIKIKPSLQYAQNNRR